MAEWQGNAEAMTQYKAAVPILPVSDSGKISQFYADEPGFASG